MDKLKKILATAILCAMPAAFAQQKYELTPADSPVERLTSKRSQMVLNGVWECAPMAVRGEPMPADGEWGKMLVPGFYFADIEKKPTLPCIVERGKTQRWKADNKYERCWIRRDVKIPENWRGEIVLKVEHVMTVARVFVNGKDAGIVSYMDDSLDISKFAKAGETVSIALLVGAHSKPSDIYYNKPASKKEKPDPYGGINGDVFLISRPAGVQISDAFVKTSVELKKIDIDLKFENLRPADYEVSVKISDADGNVAKTFSRKAKIESPFTTVSDTWENPKLWDVKEPNLYWAEISVKKNGKTLDTIKQRFGFREFRVVGKYFFLNGKKVRLIPLHNFYEDQSGGVREAISNVLDSMAECNFNALELWPWVHSAKARESRKVWAEIANEKGFLILYPANAGNADLKWDWDDIDARDRWLARFKHDWNEIKNNPSVIALMTISNTFNNHDSANPMKLGNSLRYKLVEDMLPQSAQGKRLVATMKMYDQTRPVSGHHSCVAGDFESTNNYLDYTPLQEREEWLSEWAKNGNVPYCAIEFGTPFFGNFTRDRRGPYSSYVSEPLLTEFVAPYLGAAAYADESDAYRKMVSDDYVEKSKQWKPMNETDAIRYAKTMSDFQAMFNKNTWRSWRAWGIPGGMVPWRDAYGWPSANGNVDLPYKHGKLGWQPKQATRRGFYGMSKNGATPNASGKALIENQKHGLAWIGGKPFTDKSHHFYGGDKIEKSAVITNDLRKDAEYSLEWTATFGGKKIASGKLEGVAPVGETAFAQFAFGAPQTDAKAKGKITLNGKVGGIENSDEFEFTVYPQTKFPSATVKVFDPDGKTAKYLESLGVKTVPWDGSSDGGLIVIGENAFAEKPAGKIQAFVKDGGSVLVLSQPEEILEKSCGLRLSQFVSRRMFVVPTVKDHPVVAGLDSEDFRDWRGAGTFAPERKMVDTLGDPSPKYGWHWGNRGSVASQSLEKPHRSGWRPLLEGEFDLSFSPLMEREIGKGVAVFCGLDLIGRTQRDPVADIVLSRLISTLSDRKPAQKAERPTFYIGDKRGEQFLSSLGIKFEKTDKIPQSGLVIVGEDSNASDAEMLAAMENGANFVLIERANAAPRFGIAKKDGRVSKALGLPDWREFRGVSLSDAHTRADIPAKIFDTKDSAFGGIWAVYRHGKGAAFMASLLPDEFDLDKQPYLKYTSWRMYRTFSQLAGNLGAKFDFDGTLFAKNANTNDIPLDGEKNAWKCLPAKYVKGDASKADFDDSKWKSLFLPSNTDQMGTPLYPQKRPYWARKQVFVPKSWKNDKLAIKLGKIVGCDEIYFNGVKLGEYTGDPWKGWLFERSFELPSDIVKFGDYNTVSIFVKQPVSTGRISGGPLKITRGASENQYMPNYSDDQHYGDSPFRFLGW